ncbi:hypothetical protein NBRC116187_01280 [Halopseudomonas sabulinigri]|uniref:Type VI secretion system (T6SS), amidase effector protein 4 n=1 Tax=Halopseudomonas sabulinigri TaxID=472181 RepID=A0ABP9ZJX2_9GAMM
MCPAAYSCALHSRLGGNVAELRRANPAAYTNACALRLSRGFNYGGYAIPKGTIFPGTDIYRAKGADGLPYILRVNNVIHFVRHNWGAADKVLKPSEHPQLSGIQGLIVIEVNGWSDASGHVALWNGSVTGDGSDYQNPRSHAFDSPAVSPKHILYWELK